MKRVVIGLDQGVKTGWGIAAERGRVVEHGLARNHKERIAAARRALEYAGGDPKWLWVCFEQHDHFQIDRLSTHDRETARRAGNRAAAPERSLKGYIGMGKSYGRWLELFEMLEVPDTHVDEVQPHTWRARLGLPRGGDVKQASIDRASQLAGVKIADDNHAEGYLITTWAAIDGFGRYDAGKAESRMERRIKKQLESQGDLFKGGT